MIKTEIIVLTNNIILPFQDLRKDHGLNFVDLNKLYATQSIAEHGLGFLINIYNVKDPNDDWGAELLYKIVFDTGSTNRTFLHNVDVRGISLYDVNSIVLSHWHYDHIGGLYGVLERIEHEIPIICHEDAKFERFFKRAKEVKNNDLAGKKREEILHLLSAMKIVNQEPIDLERIQKLNDEIIFTKKSYELFKIDDLKIIVSGEIPRNRAEEEFHNFFSLQDGILKEDKILDDKFLILEWENHIKLLSGCCHSGIMNTLDYVKSITDKPVSHIIGGFHMASASNQRIRNTLEYLKTFQKYKNTLYLFPIHCTGEKFVNEINKANIPTLKAFNASVGTVFNF